MSPIASAPLSISEATSTLSETRKMFLHKGPLANYVNTNCHIQCTVGFDRTIHSEKPKYLNLGVIGWKLSDKLIFCRDLGRTIYLRHKKRRRGWKSSRKFSIISYREQQVSSRSNATLKHHNSGLERAFDKIPKPNIIYWEVAIPSDGQNKSIPLDLDVQLSYNLQQRLFKR